MVMLIVMLTMIEEDKDVESDDDNGNDSHDNLQSCSQMKIILSGRVVVLYQIGKS